MHFTPSTVAAFCLSVGTAAAFSRTASPAFAPSRAFVNGRNSAVQSGTVSSHNAGCACPACVVHTPGCACSGCISRHSAVCACSACRGNTRLFMSESPTEEAAEKPAEAEATVEATAEATVEATVEAADVPAEVEALDGIDSEDEAHNADRPARAALKKKRAPKGKPLSEFKVGDSVSAKVKTITAYGAFLDIGSTTDGLLHISNLSSGFVSDVNEILVMGQEMEVRITNIDEAKSQVGLTLLTEEEEQEASKPRQPRQQRSGGRRDDSAVAAGLAGKGWDREQFVEGTVASTVDFGAFVRFDASLLNPDVEGEMDGLVHISALSAGRASSVESVCDVGDKVQVRVKSIDGRKVSLTMLSVEDEKTKKTERRSSGGEPVDLGAKDWRESLEKITAAGPSYTNGPAVSGVRPASPVAAVAEPEVAVAEPEVQEVTD